MGLINNMRARAREDAALDAAKRAARAKSDDERKSHETYAEICRRQARVLRRSS